LDSDGVALPSPGEVVAAGSADLPAEMLTETMAQLYLAQGFHDRAIEVYRALLRQRPEDVHLVERLRDAEAAADTAAEEAAGRAAAATPSADDDGWAESVESAWTGGGGVAGVDPTPYAWTDQVGEERPVGGPIRTFLQDLIAWRSGTIEIGPVSNGEATTDAEGERETETGESADDDVDLVLTEESIVDASESGAQPAGRDDSAAGDWFERAGGGAEPDEAEAEADLDMFRSWLQSLKK
jgi:hypothetical protein